MSRGPITVAGQIASGLEFTVHNEADLVALRVGDLVAVTHPRWMTFDCARRTAAALLAVLPASDEETGR